MTTRRGGAEFNSNLAMRSIPRPGLAGASWLRASPVPEQQQQQVHMRVACGISGKITKHWGPERPLSASLRAQEARRAVSYEPVMPLEKEHEPLWSKPQPPAATTNPSQSPLSQLSQPIAGVAPLQSGSGSDVRSPSVVKWEDASMGSATVSPEASAESMSSLSPTGKAMSGLIGNFKLRKDPSPRTMKKMSELSRQMVEKMSTAVNAFKFMDKDGSGSLTLDELCNGLREIGIEFDNDVLKRMVENADLSYDGSIEYPEFIRFFIGKFVPQQDEKTQRRQRAGVLLKQLLTKKFDDNDDGGISAEELRMAFREFDRDGDGWVSPLELEKGLVNLGIKDASHAHLVCELLTDHDGNDDGMINYHEFIALSGLEITDRTGYDVAAGKGGATQGFKALSNYDQNVLKRDKMQGIKEGKEVDLEPDTPKGHTAWRKRYLKAFCGTKYLSESEKEAARIVSARAKKGFARDPVPLTGAEKMYFTQVLGAERDEAGNWKRSETHVNNEYFGEWKSQAHEDMAMPFSTKYKPAPSLPRVDQKGLSEGTLIPSSENPALSRETGPFRRVNLLTEEFKGIQDIAIRGSVQMGGDDARKLVSVRGEGKFKMSSSTKELRKPHWQTRERHKPLKKVAEAKMGGGEDGDKEVVESSAWTNGESLRGPIDIESPFSRFGGMWSLLDSAGHIMDQSDLRQAPPPPQADTKPLVTTAFEHRRDDKAPSKLSSAGKLTTDTDAYIFHSPPMSRDLFARTLLGSHSSGGLLPAHMVNRAKSRMASPARSAPVRPL